MAENRYIPNDDQPLLREPQPQAQLLWCLTRIVQECPPQTPWKDTFKSKPIGLWTGPTSIAYLFFRLSETHPNIQVDGQGPVEWCSKYLDCGSQDIPDAHGLNGWGVKNEYLAYNTVKAVAAQSSLHALKVTQTILGDYHCPESDDEHLSGRAGALALLRILRRYCAFAQDEADRCIELLIQQIMSHTPWRFHGHNYTGAAHGVIGILTQIVLSDGAMGKDEAIESLITEQLDLQADDGHWFITHDPGVGSPDLVHYCHGSPGYVISLLAMRPFLKVELQNRIDTAVELGRREVWQKGLLRKEPNLCHGIVGNMLALGEWSEKEHFMAHATGEYISEAIAQGEFIAGDDAFGLLWGEAGRAWGWMMMDCGHDMGYPSYTDI
ncbi:hypothetical protein QQS21_009451 [Conoideocrella luteorostrata]|uniref:Lanthionine synthetase C-like protein n=1 Tax=Conoideocrella luteorostrata TaxID=1105319 RepID=A0AAJ0CJ87_9HYPO|nr:hypothetical protein QQS21_009451 [Conoideocrella luteorostrata]